MTKRIARRPLAAALAAFALMLPLSAAAAQEVPPRVALAATDFTYGFARQPISVHGEAGADVQLYATTAPLNWFKVIRTGRLSATGSTSFVIEPGANTRLYAVVAGVQSPTVTVRVHRLVDLVGVQLINDRRNLYRFRGNIRPALDVGVPFRAHQVTLAKVLGDGRVVGVASAVTGRDGAWDVVVNLSPGTHLYYVLVAATEQHAVGRSRLYGLKVT